MSVSRIAQGILQFLFGFFLIIFGVHLWLKALTFERKLDERDPPFNGYTNLADCIAKNWGKRRDPEQYCRAIRRKVLTARRRKYGR
jgi:hypothetical protein